MFGVNWYIYDLLRILEYIKMFRSIECDDVIKV